MTNRIFDRVDYDGTATNAKRVVFKSHFLQTSSPAADRTKEITYTDGTISEGDYITIKFTNGSSYSGGSLIIKINDATYSLYMGSSDYCYIKPGAVILARRANGSYFYIVNSGCHYYNAEVDIKSCGGLGEFDSNYYVLSKAISVSSSISATNTKQTDFTLIDSTGLYGMYMGCCGWSSSNRYLYLFNYYITNKYIDDTNDRQYYEFTAYLYNCRSSAVSSGTFTMYFLFKKDVYDQSIFYPGG